MSDPDSYHRIQQAMKPLLMTLKIFGLYYIPSVKGEDDNKTKEAWEEDDYQRKSRCGVFQKVYCILVAILLTFSTLRYIPCFWVGMEYVPGLVVHRVIQITWFIQNNLSLIIILRNCQNATWEEYFNLWNESIADTKCMHLTPALKKLHVFSLVSVVIAIFFLLFNVIGGMVLVLVLDGEYKTIFINPFTDSWLWKIVFCICLIYYSAVWVFTVCIIIISCKSIRDAFYVYQAKLKCTINNPSSNFPENLETLRRRHLVLCKLVEILDRPTAYLLMLLLATYIFLACFILYQLVNFISTANTVALVMFIMWLCTSFLATGLVSWNVALVHEAAHSPLEHIYDIQTDNLTTQQLGQLTLFLSKLTGTSIGFTAMSLFTVTKEVLLTIGGLYLSYFFILLQFKIS